LTPVRAAAVSLSVGLVLADSSVAVLALPAIYRELEVDLGDLHWVLTTFNLVLALAAIPAARVTRRAGATRTFASGLVLFALASAGCALASSFGALLVFRCIQALGGAAAVVAALELLPQLVGSARRAIAVWVAAGVVGAALGPAVGGVLTETISWQAVFAVQVPLALVPLPFLLGLRPKPQQADPRAQPRVAPNVALALVSAGLAAALFLVVLLLIEGWRLSPIEAAAVVSVLPLAAIASTPIARRVESASARAASGVFLVAGGLAALGLLPRAGWAWTVPPQILVGAGLALAVTALTEAAVVGRLQAFDGGVTIAARHAGVVLGLLVLTPLLVGDFNNQRRSAEQAGTARLLDSELSTRTKIDLTRELNDRLEAAPRQIPALSPAFESVGVDPEQQSELERLEHALDDIVDRAVTSTFSRSFLIAAVLALAALVPIGVLWRASA
jgi:MFS family permease